MVGMPVTFASRGVELVNGLFRGGEDLDNGSNQFFSR
jgi:hypothetical protein